MYRALFLGLLALLVGGLLPLSGADEPTERKIDFLRDIQPILAQNCTACHGFDAAGRKGSLRLDVRDSALARKAIVPGDVKASRLVRRIDSHDPVEQMPPPESKKQLTEAQKKLLRDWVAQGAPYAQHWAFTPPQRPALPAVKNADWARNPIDVFVLARLERERLAPASEADRGTLLRRVTLDLTGLPPSPEELAAFLADTAPNAYEKVVERLLTSPRHAERMALAWLDTARYADSNGFNNDEARSQWPWRDWVIQAYRENLPYDRFLTEQLAGDLLPSATLDQRVASAFHRNQVYNTEGGIIPEEYRVEYVADRVHTTATVFLGLSMQCARCHDHKYDPISQREYYQFAAFFNSVVDRPPHAPNLGPGQPFLRVPVGSQRLLAESLEKQRADRERQRKEREGQVDAALRTWEQGLTPEAIRDLGNLGLLLHLPLDEKTGDAVHGSDGVRRGTVRGKAGWKPGTLGGSLELDGATHAEITEAPTLDRDSPFTFALWVNPAANGTGALLSKMDDAAAYRGYDVLLESGKVAVHLVHRWPDNAVKILTKGTVGANAWHHVAVTYDGSSKAAGLKVYIDGKHAPHDASNDSLRDTFRTERAFHLGKRQASLNFRGLLDEVQVYGLVLSPEQVVSLAERKPLTLGSNLLSIAPENRTPAQQEQIRRFYLERIDREYARLRTEEQALARQKTDLEKNVPTLMVMQEGSPRETFLLRRGQYDQPGEKVTHGVPAVLSGYPAEAPRNRLGLAQWLVDPAHPLTARVAVNRYWEMLFGLGLVRTVEDFGTTGELPSHPELLDFLATEFVRSGWDTRAILRLMVTSATYRQSSRIAREMLDRDPENRLLARGARHRLPAEMIRDNALAISGLLRESLGGPSVKPYQPAGLWEDVTVSRGGKYVADQGANLYRRGMYTFWKRTCPPPGLMTFDAPNREVCLPRRATTNTPLQALILLNDPTYLEAARKLAERMLLEGGDTAESRLDYAFQRAVARPAQPAERRILQGLLDAARTRFRADPERARQLLAVGESPRDAQLDAIEHAAWTTVASTILNLDETISRR